MVAVGAAGLVRFDEADWVALLLVSAVVLSAEVFNTVVERLLDLVEPRLSIHVALLKDLLALAVLVVSLAAFVIGLVLFGHYL